MQDYETTKDLTKLFISYTGDQKSSKAIKDLLQKVFDYYGLKEYRTMFLEDTHDKFKSQEYRFTNENVVKLIAFLSSISLTDCPNTQKDYPSAIKNPYKKTSKVKTVSKMKAYTEYVINTAKKIEADAINNDCYIINYEELFSALNLADFAEQMEDKLTNLIMAVFFDSSHSPALLQKILDRMDACISEVLLFSELSNTNPVTYNTPDVSIAAVIADQLFCDKNKNSIVINEKFKKSICNSHSKLSKKEISQIKTSLKKQLNMSDYKFKKMMNNIHEKTNRKLLIYQNKSDVHGSITDFNEWLKSKNTHKRSYKNYLNYLIENMTYKYYQMHNETNKEKAIVLVKDFFNEFGIYMTGTYEDKQSVDIENWIFRELESIDTDSFSCAEAILKIKEKAYDYFEKSTQNFESLMSDSSYSDMIGNLKKSIDAAFVKCFNLYTENDLKTINKKVTSDQFF